MAGQETPNIAPTPEPAKKPFDWQGSLPDWAKKMFKESPNEPQVKRMKEMFDIVAESAASEGVDSFGMQRRGVEEADIDMMVEEGIYSKDQGDSQKEQLKKQTEYAPIRNMIQWGKMQGLLTEAEAKDFLNSFTP